MKVQCLLHVIDRFCNRDDDEENNSDFDDIDKINEKHDELNLKGKECIIHNEEFDGCSVVWEVNKDKDGNEEQC